MTEKLLTGKLNLKTNNKHKQIYCRLSLDCKTNDSLLLNAVGTIYDFIQLPIHTHFFSQISLAPSLWSIYNYMYANDTSEFQGK